MIATVRLRALVLTILVATPSILALAGCGAPSDSDPAAKDPTTQSVSKYEAEIAKSKAATPAKGAK